MKKICPWCINDINENTYHCFLCNKCFEFQQFHDIYLNNCIGKKNFGLYLNFLYYLTIVSSFKFFISFLSLFWLTGENYSKSIKINVCQIIMVSGFIIFGVYKIKTKSKTKKDFLNFRDSSQLTIDNGMQKMNIEMENLENS